MTSAELIMTIISTVCGSIIIGVSGAFTWFKSSKAHIYARLEQLERDMRASADKHSIWHLENSKKLYGLEIHQANTEESLKEIRDLSYKTSRTIERLLQAMVSRGANQINGDKEG